MEFSSKPASLTILSKVKIEDNVKLGMPVTPQGQTLPSSLVSSTHGLGFLCEGIAALPEHPSHSSESHYLDSTCALLALLDNCSTVVQSWCLESDWKIS